MKTVEEVENYLKARKLDCCNVLYADDNEVEVFVEWGDEHEHLMLDKAMEEKGYDVVNIQVENRDRDCSSVKYTFRLV